MDDEGNDKYSILHMSIYKSVPRRSGAQGISTACGLAVEVVPAYWRVLKHIIWDDAVVASLIPQFDAHFEAYGRDIGLGASSYILFLVQGG